MKPYYYLSSQFEYPLVMTKEILLKVFDNELKDNRDNSKLDLGGNIPIYDWYLNKSHIIEPNEVISFTEFVLFNYANAFKYLDDEMLTDRIKQEAKKLRNQSLGSIIDNASYDYIIKQAVINKDTILVVPKHTIRFLKNPYYTKDKKQFKLEINQNTNREIVEKNYISISNGISDYDLNKKKLTKTILKDITGHSIATIKNYLKNYEELNEMFDEVKKHSGTIQQIKDKKYNETKISKTAK